MMRVACLGAGYFSQFHVAGWHNIPGTQVAGICDTNVEAAKATRLPVHDTLDNMLLDTAPDILDIIISPAGHAQAIKTALQHDLRAIICQKPFCTSLQEAQAITALAAEKGTPLIIHENFRFQPWYRTIAKAIATGRIGRPLQATFRLRPGDGQGPEAYLDRQPYFQTMERFLVHETAVHWIDTFRFLFGNPSAVYADLRKVNPVIAGEDAGVILFDHANGVRTLFDGNRSLDHAAENTRCTMGEAEFEGTEGVLSLRGDGSVDLRAFGDRRGQLVLGPDTSGTFGGNCAGHLQAHVIGALRGENDFENRAEDYLTVMQIEAAIYASNASGCKVDLTETLDKP